MYDNHQVDIADHECSVTVPPMHVTGDPDITIYMSAHGGGTVGEAYAHNGWTYAVTAGGSEICAGDDLRSGAPATHEEMARTLASFLAAAGESLRWSGDRSEYADEYAGEMREFLETEYERFADFAMDPDDLDS